MTLLGKLFRPWDLQVDDSEEKSEESFSEIKSTITSEESDQVPSPDVFIDHNRCFNFGDKKDSVPTAIVKAQQTNESASLRSSQVVKNLMVANESSQKSDNNIVLNKKSRHLETKFSGDFDLNMYNNTTQTSQMFLHPTAINDLANLSRNELTAMGLLPPDAPSTMKVKRQRPKRFHCPHCQVAFSNNGQLRGHVRIHTGKLSHFYITLLKEELIMHIILIEHY